MGNTRSSIVPTTPTAPAPGGSPTPTPSSAPTASASTSTKAAQAGRNYMWPKSGDRNSGEPRIARIDTNLHEPITGPYKKICAKKQSGQERQEIQSDFIIGALGSLA